MFGNQKIILINCIFTFLFFHKSSFMSLFSQKEPLGEIMILEILNGIKKETSYDTKCTFLALFLADCSARKFKIKKSTEVYNFCIDELKSASLALDDTKGFAYNDVILTYGESILNLLFATNLGNEGHTPVIQNFINLISKYHDVEEFIYSLSHNKVIEASDTTTLINKMKDSPEDKLEATCDLILFLASNNKFNLDTNSIQLFNEFVLEKFRELTKNFKDLNAEQQNLVYTLGYLLNIYHDPETVEYFKTVVGLSDELDVCILNLLLKVDDKTAESIASRLAKNELFAGKTYKALRAHNKLHYFPAELNDPAYISKSMAIYWLNSPAELGETPQKIELIGKTHANHSDYYVYKFMSNCPKLAEQDRNVWLVCWANLNGNIFTYYTKLSELEQVTTEKTLKHIAKNQISTAKGLCGR